MLFSPIFMKLVVWMDCAESLRLKIGFSTASGCAGDTNNIGKSRKGTDVLGRNNLQVSFTVVSYVVVVCSTLSICNGSSL